MFQKVNNLSLWINKTSHQIIETIKKKGKESSKYKNEIDKALGVLLSDGVYAYYVYTKSRGIDDVFVKEIRDIKKFVPIKGVEDEQELTQEYFERLSMDLPSLLFFRDILERILVYTRYHAKAMEDEGNDE